jgi:hypothetical protein
MFYQALVTSDDPGHDALDVPGETPSDALLLDVNASVALSFVRSQVLLQGNAALSQTLSTFDFVGTADKLFAAMNGTYVAGSTTVSLWDGVPDNSTATMGAGYMEGYVPSTGQMLTNKPTRGNAMAMAALHHIETDIGGTYTWQSQYLIAVVTAQVSQNTGLLTVFPGQIAYLPAASKGFTFAPVYGPDGGDAGTLPLAKSYTSKAIDVACESLNEFWYGFRH